MLFLNSDDSYTVIVGAKDDDNKIRYQMHRVLPKQPPRRQPLQSQEGQQNQVTASTAGPGSGDPGPFLAPQACGIYSFRETRKRPC